MYVCGFDLKTTSSTVRRPTKSTSAKAGVPFLPPPSYQGLIRDLPALLDSFFFTPEGF